MQEKKGAALKRLSGDILRGTGGTTGQKPKAGYLVRCGID